MIVKQIVLLSFRMWFDIKCKTSICNALRRHVYKEITIVRDVLPKEIRDIMEKHQTSGLAYFFYSEDLFSFLSSEDGPERMFAVKNNIKIRDNSERGNLSIKVIRPNHLNLPAKYLRNLLIGNLHFEPILTSNMTKKEIEFFFLIKSFNKTFILCHT